MIVSNGLSTYMQGIYGICTLPYLAISIGFELPEYTYTEPLLDTEINEFYFSPTGLAVNGPIYLAKENNVTSEQTFIVHIEFFSNNWWISFISGVLCGYSKYGNAVPTQ